MKRENGHESDIESDGMGAPSPICGDELRPFERVRDKETDDSVLVVVEHCPTKLKDYKFAAVTAADLNVPYGYDPEDSVVVAVSQHRLECRFGDTWHEWDADELRDNLLYSRPEGKPVMGVHPHARDRLERYDAANFQRLDDGKVRCNYCSSVEESISDWVEHTVTGECDGYD